MSVRLGIPVIVALVTGCPADGPAATVGPRGGTLLSDDGNLTVEVRPGALEEPIAASVWRSDACDDETVACYEFEPWGVPLAVPATVVFEYDGAMVPTDLRLTVEGPNGWSPMPDPGYDADEGHVWASVTYLTALQVL